MKNTKQNIFRLSNVVLYAKGWYKMTDNVWEDLKQILELDDYTPFTKGDVYSIILNAFENYKCRQSTLKEVLIGITPKESWNTGYYTKGNANWLSKEEQDKLPDYKLEEAFIRYVLSTLRFFSIDQYNNHTPLYSKYPKNEIIETKKIIEMFNK